MVYVPEAGPAVRGVPAARGVGPVTPRRCAAAGCRTDPVTGAARPRPAAPPALICAACRRQNRAALRSLPALFDECAEVLAHPHRGPAERVSGGGGSGIPLNEAAVGARLDIIGVLASWAALVVRNRDVRGPHRRSVPDLAAFLAGQLDWLAAHPAAGDFTVELADLVRAGRLTAYPPAEHRTDLGRCARAGCDRPVVLAAGGDGRPARVSCAQGHVWAPDQWLLLRLHQQRAGRAG